MENQPQIPEGRIEMDLLTRYGKGNDHEYGRQGGNKGGQYSQFEFQMKDQKGSDYGPGEKTKRRFQRQNRGSTEVYQLQQKKKGVTDKACQQNPIGPLVDLFGLVYQKNDKPDCGQAGKKE
jgi:hypothetical protein